MTDLKTTYLGLELKNPLVAAASALLKTDFPCPPDGRCRGQRRSDVFPVEEQIVQDSLAFNYFMERGTESFAKP